MKRIKRNYINKPSTQPPSKNNINNKTLEAADLKLSLQIPDAVQLERSVSLDRYVDYGYNNLYPNYLVKLYNDSSIHNAIIKSKVNYILGDGVVSKSTKKALLDKVNKEDTIENLLMKLIKDYIIFGYYGLEVVYGADGSIFEINHVPSNLIRTNVFNDKFWFCPDWVDQRNKILTFDRWSKEVPQTLESRLFFHRNYSPSVYRTYPTPDYMSAIKSIEIDSLIKDFHLNNISTGFSGSTIITFFRGETTTEEKEIVRNAVVSNLSGPKGDKVILSWQEKDEEKPDVQQLGATNWNEAYLTLREHVTEDIITAHEVTSPMLFGIKTEGQLGGASELETSYSIFKNLYVKAKRREILESINQVMSETRFGEIEILDKERLFKVELEPATREKILTINELRAIDGLAPIQGGDRMIDSPVVVSENSVSTVENSIGTSKDEYIPDETDQKLYKIGEAPEEFDLIRKQKVTFSAYTDKLTDFLLRTNLTGLGFQDIQNKLFELTKEVYPLKTIKEEYARLVSTKTIPNTGQLDNSDLRYYREKYAPEVNQDGRLVETRYSYEGPVDGKNRAFCHRLVRANKLYTRADIQNISNLFGYDVFTERGGYGCRHTWVLNSVVRK